MKFVLERRQVNPIKKVISPQLAELVLPLNCAWYRIELIYHNVANSSPIGIEIDGCLYVLSCYADGGGYMAIDSGTHAPGRIIEGTLRLKDVAGFAEAVLTADKYLTYIPGRPLISLILTKGHYR